MDVTPIVNAAPVVNANDPSGLLDLFKTLGGFGMCAYLLIKQQAILTSLKDSVTTLTAIVAARDGDDRRINK